MHIIIGGSGFLGGYLSAELQRRGEEVLICDKTAPQSRGVGSPPFQQIDVTEFSTLERIGARPEDTVYHLAATLLVPIVRRKRRKEVFFGTNYHGTVNLMRYLEARSCTRVIYFTTDMVYGHTVETPRNENHPLKPIGPYGESKLRSENFCREQRQNGMRITIFRPRLIIGPGRLGILRSLFRLIELGLPIPLIGDGFNHYQFVSVHDCVQAALLAHEADVPNSEYNLGSEDPPTVRELLSGLIGDIGSHSILLPTPASVARFGLEILDRLGMPLLDPEQYLIADETCILSTDKIKAELGWRPEYSDSEMLRAAYDEYRSTRTNRASLSLARNGHSSK